ncbi:MAG: hypothetical protein H0U81_10400 [Pyrinomonadaceae bacterium]|nr:hypothetical protein [Pyrinomonadaceae bacterium]
MSRRTRNNGSGHKPVLTFERIERKNHSSNIDVRVIERIKRYPDYVFEMTGIKPSADEVVERALEQTFEADSGYKAWLAKQRPTAAATDGVSS